MNMLINFIYFILESTPSDIQRSSRGSTAGSDPLYIAVSIQIQRLRSLGFSVASRK